VLIVAPLSGHHATLLRDTVRALLPDHKVWITDWIDARWCRSAGPFHLDDYVAYVQEFIRHARAGRAPDLGVPADGAGAGRGVADGQRRRSEAAPRR
jgi:poly(3-hydroxybutyrate) depolymerase